MKREMKSLIDNKTWELIESPKNQQVVESKWVYKIKDRLMDANEKIHKSRLVAKGFIQKKTRDPSCMFMCN